MEKIPKRELNKKQKKEWFIDSAERLFIEKGFENASIDEIARKAGLTKRTLYQYFLSKEDLFYAVVLKGVRQLLSVYEQAMEKGESTLDKIRLGNRAYLIFYRENLDMFRLMNYAPANNENCEKSPHYHEIKVLDERRLQYYMSFVAAGAADGSINPKLDINKALFFAFFSPFSLLYTISTMNMWGMLNIDEQEFLQFSFDMIVNALK